MIEVIDDVLDDSTFKVIYEVVSKHDFLWRWAPSTVEGVAEAARTDTPQLVRPIMMAEFDDKCSENQIIGIWPEFQNIMLNTLAKSERKFTDCKFWRIKANLLMPHPHAPTFHPPHTDTDAENGMSCIYYLNDSDGDTFFFGEDNRTVTPKENRAVLFDAHHHHCSSNPINTDRRMIINTVAFVQEEN